MTPFESQQNHFLVLYISCKVMFNFLEELPLMLVGTRIFDLLNLSDIIMLERACGSQKSHQLFLDLVPLCPSVELPSSKHKDISCLEWFIRTKCNIKYLTIYLPWKNPAFHNLQVDEVELHLQSNVTMVDCKTLFENNLTCCIHCIVFYGALNKDVIEKLSSFAGNVDKIDIVNSSNIKDWLNIDILARWKLKELSLSRSEVSTLLFTLIVQTCTELTSITLDSTTVDDSVVMAIAQHCTKLQNLTFTVKCRVTYKSLIALSERGLPLKELDIQYIPNIPTADIAHRCSHALSCIRHLDSCDLHMNDLDANILISYLTGLTSVNLDIYADSYIPLLTQYCHKLTKMDVDMGDFESILPLCRANPLLQELTHFSCGVTDTILIELVHTCPQLHTLYLPNETDITDIGILALSEHCPQLQELYIDNCVNVTETAVLRLLQRCRKLTILEISSSSLSKETWTQLDRSTQKRVSRW